MGGGRERDKPRPMRWRVVRQEPRCRRKGKFQPLKGTAVCKSWEGIPVQRQVCEELERQRDGDEDGGGRGVERKEWFALFPSSPQDQNHVRNKPLLIYVREL